MGKFLTAEKPIQAEFKRTAQYFSDAARKPGTYKKHTYPFCLPRELANENLVPGIRETAPTFFAKHKIKWHDGQNGMPSNHLCDSMVCCVNFLFPFADEPQALQHVLSYAYQNISEMLTIEDDKYVTFEWIGQRNYLGEKIARHGKRTRGANCTSVDAAVMFQRNDGRRQIVLIEWKYTESYSSTNMKYARKSGTDRTAIYQHLFDADTDLLNKTKLPSFDALFYEPFYQLMRQQYLANEMEKAHELGADIVSLLHIAPAHNLDFKRITSPDLRSLGNSATDVWSKFIKKSGRFLSVHTENLFGQINTTQHPEMQAWKDYIFSRYTWMQIDSNKDNHDLA